MCRSLPPRRSRRPRSPLTPHAPPEPLCLRPLCQALTTAVKPHPRGPPSPRASRPSPPSPALRPCRRRPPFRGLRRSRRRRGPAEAPVSTPVLVQDHLAVGSNWGGARDTARGLLLWATWELLGMSFSWDFVLEHTCSVPLWSTMKTCCVGLYAGGIHVRDRKPG